MSGRVRPFHSRPNMEVLFFTAVFSRPPLQQQAVQLLLAYPKCNALPVVSPIRLTVMGYLTLSGCLASVLNRLRGEHLQALAELKVGGEFKPEEFNSAKYKEDEGKNSCWVLSQSQPLRELLHFFTKTHHSTIPVVDSSSCLVYNLSRRDLLSYLDLAMQSVLRSDSDGFLLE